MMIQSDVVALVQEALDALVSTGIVDAMPAAKIQIERPRDASHGDFSTNIAMVLSKPLKMSPRVVAEHILTALPKHPDIASVTLAGPGFINFTFTVDALIHRLNDLSNAPRLGVSEPAESETVVVDYSSPNLAKEMHVGHLRSTIIGDALARIFAFKGYHVVRQNHVGDWGTQFGMLLAHLADKSDVAHELSNLEVFYKEAKLRFDQEPDFAERARQLVVQLQSGDEDCHRQWETFIHLSLTHCQAIYERLGVLLTRDDLKPESSYNADLMSVVDVLNQQALLVNSEGALCVFLDEFKGKNDEPLPIIIQKSDGGFLYATTDLAAIRYRQSVLNASRVLYVVDARQTLHFQQMFALAKRIGFASPSLQLDHVAFGMVLDQSGRPFKSRDGGVTKLADLLDEAESRALALIVEKNPTLEASECEKMAKIVGISSIKYADLSKNRLSDYVFDWDHMISFEGNTAPYLLYALTRVNSLFNKAGMDKDALIGYFQLTTPFEIHLGKQLSLFSEVIDTVIERAAPHLLCAYLYDLATAFSSFYEHCPILNLDDEALKISRLKLAALVSRVLGTGLGLLGIETLTRM